MRALGESNQLFGPNGDGSNHVPVFIGCADAGSMRLQRRLKLRVLLGRWPRPVNCDSPEHKPNGRQ